jgi:hypothetical protein
MTPSLGIAAREALIRALQDDPLWGSDSPGDNKDQPKVPIWDRFLRTRHKSIRDRADDVTAMLGTVDATVTPLQDGGRPLQIASDELELLAEEEHKRWMRVRAGGGWRRGPVKDSTQRTHPSMIPYERLSESERDKDRERILRLPEILAQAGLGVIRRAPPCGPTDH